MGEAVSTHNEVCEVLFNVVIRLWADGKGPGLGNTGLRSTAAATCTANSKQHAVSNRNRADA
jgi:hypothetical protein